MLSHFVSLIAGLAALAALPGCPSYGVIDDGTSISWGPSNNGTLMNPRLLPREGDGYVIPPIWKKRGLNYGTDEMIRLIVHVGRRMAVDSPGAVFGVGDISKQQGGPSAWHRSHQSGRDVDLIFFVKDANGKPTKSYYMRRFNADGATQPGGKKYLFDVERNWLLVRAAIENPIAKVQYMFVYDPLKQLLLDHAREIGEPEGLIEQASHILHQPGDSLPHDDHCHMRIYCSLTDRQVGCVDRGVLRWTKKGYKYRSEKLAGTIPASARTAFVAPMPMAVALGTLAC